MVTGKTPFINRMDNENSISAEAHVRKLLAEATLSADDDENSDDPSTELVADIESRLESEFPELQQRPQVIQTIRTVVQEKNSMMFVGPHPPPHMLAEYERICPGSAEKLLKQGEVEQQARIEFNREQLAQTRLMIQSEADTTNSNSLLEHRGQILGFVAFLIIAGIGMLAMWLHETGIAITCFTTFVLGVLGFFIQKRTAQASNSPEDFDPDEQTYPRKT